MTVTQVTEATEDTRHRRQLMKFLVVKGIIKGKGAVAFTEQDVKIIDQNNELIYNKQLMDYNDQTKCEALG